VAAAIPFIIPQWLDLNGKPLAHGKLWTYQAGTNIPVASFTTSLGDVNNTNPVILDAAGRAPVFLAPGSYKVVLMNKNDVVQWTQDNIKPADGGGGGIVDSDYAKHGYSNRFGQLINTTGLNDTLNWIIGFTAYGAPSIVLSIPGSGTIREKGVAISTPNVLSAAITKGTNDLDQVRFNRTGTGIISTQTSGGAIPNGGTSTYSYGTAFSDTTSFTADARDVVVGGNGGTPITSNTVTFTFVYPYYSGKGAPGLTNAQIQSTMTKQVIQTAATVTTGNLTASNGETFYFAQPASYTAITSILDINGFETFADWTVSTGNLTMADGASVSYRFYRFNNTVSAGTYKYDFKR
jgi:hypothetical protein